ncbi:helix-turn-helix domain-containing protein, partial [Rosenbergiella nectarea]
LLIAQAINIHPAEIWPSRYYDPITHELLDRSQLIRTKRKKKSSESEITP